MRYKADRTSWKYTLILFAPKSIRAQKSPSRVCAIFLQLRIARISAQLAVLVVVLAQLRAAKTTYSLPHCIVDFG